MSGGSVRYSVSISAVVPAPAGIHADHGYRLSPV